MRNAILLTLGMALSLGVWGCKSKDSEPSPAAAPTAEAPPAAPGGPAPGGPAPGGPAMPGAPAGPGPGVAPPGEAAPAAGAEAAKPDAAKPAEKPAPKTDDDSDDPFSSSMTAPPRSEAGKSSFTGALGRAFLRAAAAGDNAKPAPK